MADTTNMTVAKGSKIKVRGKEHTVIGFYRGSKYRFIEYATDHQISVMAFCSTERRIFWKMVADDIIEIL